MQTPIYDFVTEYINSNAVRLHMPGHKGQNVLGFEARDITEISGADALYEASGIIAESEANATELFGTGRTLYSTEGSSQCVKAMLALTRRWWQEKNKRSVTERPVVVAARNVHKAFLYAVISLDFEIEWLWPEEENPTLCGCMVTAKTLERVLREQGDRVAAVYLTSPNYLGGMLDISSMTEVCHKYKTLLCVDNAHGAYLRFLEHSLHPMDLGADLCCDSAHKTLPVLTGGAYLHISKSAPEELKDWAKGALELFGSTSPSYLILQSLDLCNKYLADTCRAELNKFCEWLGQYREQLKEKGWQVEKTDPLRITIKALAGSSGIELAEQLRRRNLECEFADEDYVVLMVTPYNTCKDFYNLSEAFEESKLNQDITNRKSIKLPAASITRSMSVRNAYFSAGESIPVEQASGRICRMPMATCPPAVPIVVPGEVIDDAAVQSFLYYGITMIEVVKE